MKLIPAVSLIVIYAHCAPWLLAQGVPVPPVTIQLSGYDMRGSGVPAGSSSVRLSFTLELDKDRK
jgi:hypothetical protein